MNHIYECPTARSNACHPSAALINTARVDIGRPPRRAGRGNGLVGPSSASAHGKPAPGFGSTRMGGRIQSSDTPSSVQIISVPRIAHTSHRPGPASSLRASSCEPERYRFFTRRDTIMHGLDLAVSGGSIIHPVSHQLASSSVPSSLAFLSDPIRVRPRVGELERGKAPPRPRWPHCTAQAAACCPLRNGA